MIERVARTTAIGCVVMAALYALWTGTVAAAISVLAGGVLIGISFWAIRGAVDDLVRRSSAPYPGVSPVDRADTARKSSPLALVKFFTRHAIVALAAYGMMVRLRLDPVGVLAGVSSLGVAVGIEALRDLRWRRFL
ncbi:MAG TPA: hypothetical protein VEC39_11230 [Vicinamibacterales bacterium]|nr:hypothetical protein [Vicinamibacterales bacterium]